MAQARRALVFTNATGTDPVLVDVLRQCALTPLWPWELEDQAIRVLLIIVERPAQNAIKICANLRNQGRFSAAPILVLLDATEQAYGNELAALDADIIFKPIRGLALQRYISAKVPPPAPGVTTPMPPPPINHSSNAETVFEPPPPQAGPPPTPSKAPPAKDKSKTATTSTQTAASATKKEPGSPGASGGKTKTEPPPLQDLIPTADRLLAEMSAPAPLLKGGVVCSRCRWECRREDIFCARCGIEMAQLADPSPTVSFEPRGDHKIGQLIDFKNTGQNPVRMAFNILAANELAPRFALSAATAMLNGGSSASLLVTFDARRLDLTTNYRADLEITTNEKGRRTRRVELIVERLAVPRVTAPNPCVFVIGTDNEWELQLANDGGGTLRLLQVMLDDKALSISEPVVVHGGHAAQVRLRLPNLELSPGKHAKKMRLEFEHYKPATVDLGVEAIRPPRLTVQPVEIDFTVVSTNRSRRASLAINNAGGEELVITALDPAVHWLACLTPLPLAILPGATRIVDVEAHGAGERAGDHEGTITMHSNAYNNPAHLVPFRVTFEAPKPYERYIGVDFGTTASCVAVLNKTDDGLEPVVIELDQIEPGLTGDPHIMPSVLYFHDDGSVTAGRDALLNSAIQPVNAVTSIKRVLGMKHTRELGGQSYNATQLAAKIIEQLVVRTEDGLFRLGQYRTPRKAIVTVPVEFLDHQRRALLDACKLAGLEMESHTPKGIVIDEPRAAALSYLRKRSQAEAEVKGERLLIFDFGGGTLDCVLLEVEPTGEKILLKTLALGGDSRLGGEDIDWALVGQLADRAKAAHPDFNLDCLGSEERFKHKFRTPSLLEAALRTRAEFKRQAEMAKIALGVAEAVDVKIEPLLRRNATALEPFIQNAMSYVPFETQLTKADLDMVLAPLAGRAVEVVETVCARAGVPLDSVDTILHVGRTSQIPMVRTWVNTVLSKAEDLSHLIEPKLCVALGAAWWGYIKNRPNANIEFVGEANRTIHDIGYLDMKGMREIFVPVFPAQTEFPIETTVEIPAGKELIELHLAESRAMNTNGKAHYETIGIVRIDARGFSDPRIPVVFALDENRMVQVMVNGSVQPILELAEE